MTITLLSCEFAPAGPRMADIVAMVAERYRLTVAELKRPTREFRVSHPRQEAMWLMRQVKWPDGTQRYSMPMIARHLGLKNHTTVLHGCLAYEDRLLRAKASAEREAA